MAHKISATVFESFFSGSIVERFESVWWSNIRFMGTKLGGYISVVSCRSVLVLLLRFIKGSNISTPS